MSNSFEHIPNPTRGILLNLVSKMAEPRKKFESLREELKDNLDAYFNQRPPFPTNGQTERADIKQYVNLVNYCLEAGDTDVLKEWGIKRVKKNLSYMLASNNYKYYREVCQTARSRSQTNLEEDCWTLLIEFFTELTYPSLAQTNTHQHS